LPAESGDCEKPGTSGLDPSFDGPHAATHRATNESDMGAISEIEDGVLEKRARADGVMDRTSLLESDSEKRCL
jgi:hypothetical protein